MKYESHVEHCKSKNPCANSNPNFRSTVQGVVLSRANPNLVWSPKSLVRGNLDKMRGKNLGYNTYKSENYKGKSHVKVIVEEAPKKEESR